MNKSLRKKIVFLAVMGLFIYGLVALIRWQPESVVATSENVTIEDGIQIIDLTAKGGYAPRKTLAQAGFETVLNVQTNGTYDCSAALIIPEKNIDTFLPANGTTRLALGKPGVGTLQGTCSMGMYGFEIEFE